MLIQHEGVTEATLVALKGKEAEIKIWKTGGEASCIQPTEVNSIKAIFWGREVG